MLRVGLVSLVLAPVLWGWTAPVSFEMDQRGVVSISDGQPLARAIVNMHAPGWAGAANDDSAVAERRGDRVQGSFRLPGKSKGSLNYSVTAKALDAAVDLNYELEFSDPNEIQGAYVSFILPTARFETRTATLHRVGLSKPLPRRDEQFSLSGSSPAISFDLGDGNALVIATGASSHVLVQDNRQFGATDYEVRFHVFGRGRVVPGMIARRKFRIAVVTEKEVAGVVDAMRPKVSFDPNQPYALLRERGEVTIGTRENRLLDVHLAIHGLNWAYTGQDSAEVHMSGDSKTRFVAGSMPVPAAKGQRMEFIETASAEEDGALGLKYRLEFPEAVKLNGYQVSFSFGLDDYAGAKITLNTEEGPRELAIPEKLGEKFPHSGPVTRIAVAPDKPEGFTLDVDQPSNLLIQDNRGWGGSTIELRFNFRRQEQGEEVPAGETVERKFTFKLNSPLQIVLDESDATSETDTADWIAYTLPWDTCPVDVSFLNHKPAGKHGFISVKDGKFVLSGTGAEIRFWGTCFSAGANFPTHEQSEKIAKRLARFGVNMVRTHHADARWAERHFFPKDADNTREFDPENLDLFDYLIYCLRQEGIYIYLDQLVNRYFKPGDDVDAVEDLGACAKPYSNFDPRLIELQKEFSKNLWTHVNPYTKLAYKDDPAIAMMEFANENDLFTQQVELEPYRTRFEHMYRAWAKDNSVELPEGKVNFRAKTDDMMRFLVEVQRNYYLEMSRYLRDEVGVKVPMTGSNWSRNAALLAALRDMPFTDSHTYWHHPSRAGSFGNTAMLGSRGTVFGGLAFNRMVGKPFFVSEWDEPWPNEWRAELPCWMAAIASFQEWNGLTVYTYRHSSRVPIDHISGAFETFNDPARFGLFPHAAMIFRRGDVAGAKQRIAVHIPEELALSVGSPSPWGAPAYRALPELHRLDTALSGPTLGAPLPSPERRGAGGEAAVAVLPTPRAYDRTINVLDEASAPDDIRESDTRQVWRSIKQKIAKLDSPRSQVIFGYLGEAGAQSTTDLTVDCDSLFATIALSSLTDAPIRESNRLLLTAVGRAENTGFRYNMLRNKRIASGGGPILIDPIRATISIRTDQRDLKVWAIGADGKRLGEVATKYVDGRLSFEIGPEGRTMYYQVAVTR